MVMFSQQLCIQDRPACTYVNRSNVLCYQSTQVCGWYTVKYQKRKTLEAYAQLLCVAKVHCCRNQLEARIKCFSTLLQVRRMHFFAKPLQNHPPIVCFGREQDVGILLEQLRCQKFLMCHILCTVDCPS